jgi:hypothetical protein
MRSAVKIPFSEVRSASANVDVVPTFLGRATEAPAPVIITKRD